MHFSCKIHQGVSVSTILTVQSHFEVLTCFDLPWSTSSKFVCEISVCVFVCVWVVGGGGVEWWSCHGWQSAKK
jgi:hypothetical protein